MSQGVTARPIATESGNGHPHESIQYALESEIDLAGHACRERLVVTESELVVFGGENVRRRRRAWALDMVKEVRLESSVGSSFVQALVDGQWQDVLRLPGGSGDKDLENLAEHLSTRRQPARQNGRCGRQNDGKAGDFLGRFFAGRVPADRNRWAGTWRIVQFMHPLRAGVFLLLGLSVVAVAVDLIPPKLQGILVDRVLQAEEPQGQIEQLLVLLMAIVGGLLVVRVVATVTTIWKGYVASRVGTTLTANLRNELVKRFTELPLAYYDKNQVGMLMSRVAYDTETLHTLVHHMTSGLLLQTLQLVGIGVMLVWINPKLALVTMLPIPLIVAGSWYFLRHLNPRHHHYWEAVGAQASALTGMLSGIRVVKAFVQENCELGRFRNCSSRLRDSRQTLDVSTATFSAAMGFLFTLGHLAVWYIGGRAVLFGEMSLGDLVAFFMYLAMFYAPLTSMTEAMSWFSTFFAAGERISEVLNAPGEKADSQPGEPIGRVEGRLEFRGVTFAYQPNRPVLHDVSFSVEPGQTIGVVGRSGSGKSTLVSLIGRFYEVSQGQILVDGVDVRQMDPHELRRQIGIVLQEPFLFRGSVAANIRYAEMEASPEQILDAAKYADAHDFIMRMPFAYETRLGEGGSGLSGGERQRLSIARALVFDPAILILDEATASVDAQTEQAIRDALARFSRDRTTIIIAHRLSTLSGADRLIVFDQGRLIEQGTHEELLARGGLYRTLVDIQMNLKENRQRVQSMATVGQLDGGDFSMSEFGDDQTFLDAFPLDGQSDSQPEPSGRGEDLPRESTLRWLDPQEAVIETGPQGILRVDIDGTRQDGVYAVRAFPASYEQSYISLRHGEGPAGEVEVGMIRSLEPWPEAARKAVLGSLERRYLLRPIDDVRQVQTLGQRLDFRVQIDGRLVSFRLDKPGENVQSFGDRGLLLLDTQGRYYVIPDRNALPKHQQRLLALYFGD